MDSNMVRVIKILLLICLLIIMLFHVPLVVQGAHVGLELWYESVLPSILPFMMITSLLLQQVQGPGICYLGLLCGLPVGANLVNQSLTAGTLNLKTANSLLCICNITSPMFILGYIINHTFQCEVSAIRFLAVIYFPIGIYAFLTILKNCISCRIKSHTTSSNICPMPNNTKYSALSSTPTTQVTFVHENSDFNSILRHSLSVILSVGIYIMLFCIIIRIAFHYIPSDSIELKLLMSSFEITNGIHIIDGLSLPGIQKTALIAGLTSFGGICSILQTKSVITNKGLSIIHYTCIKMCMGIASYLLALVWL